MDQGSNKWVCLLNCLFRKCHHAWLLHFFLHKQKKRSSHHVTPEENVPFWFIYCEVSTDIFSFNTNWKKSLICRKSQLHFFSFSSQIISMPLYIQLCYWKIKKKIERNVFTVQFAIAKAWFKFAIHILCSGQKSKKKPLPFHLLHRCKAIIHMAKFSSSHLQLCHSCLHIRYRQTWLGSLNCNCKKITWIYNFHKMMDSAFPFIRFYHA